MRQQTFHFVRHSEALDWLRLGWLARPTLERTHHGEYSVMMEWLCDCEMPLLRREARQGGRPVPASPEGRAG
jgi:hypothetical protein